MKNTYGLDTTWIAGYDDPKVIAEDSLLDRAPVLSCRKLQSLSLIAVW